MLFRSREDLAYRLNVAQLRLPPLRERREDIPLLFEHFAHSAAERLGRNFAPLSGPALGRLLSHDWPGNVRELDNVMQRALILQHGDVVEAGDLMFEAAVPPAATPELEFGSVAETAPAEEESLGSDLKDHERRLIIGALEEGQGSRKFAAEKLGISPRTLRYKIARMRDAGVAVPG